MLELRFSHLVKLMFVPLMNCQLIKSSNSDDYEYVCRITDSLVAIDCDANGSFDLKLEMQRIAQQSNTTYYNSLTISGNALYTELPEDCFSGITVGSIDLNSASTLTRIHSNVFTSTANTTFRFDLHSPTQLQNSPPDYDLYYALSTLTNAITLTISLDPSVNNHTIPDNAFRNINGIQTMLFSITFSGNFKISRVGNNAFYEIPMNYDFSSINFLEIPIETVSSNAFDLQYSDYLLTIRLSGCDLTHHSFEDNVFGSSRRPLYLFIDHNRIEYIEEKTFSLFFAANERNVMNLNGNQLNCTEISRFQWLLAQKQQLESRVLFARCSDGRNLWDLEIPDDGSTSTTTITTLITTANTTQITIETTTSITTLITSPITTTVTLPSNTNGYSLNFIKLYIFLHILYAYTYGYYD